MTPSDEFINRYKEVAKQADSMGRLITVGRLRPSQQIRIQEMTPGLEGTTTMTNPDTGETMEIPRRAMPLIAAAVRGIDEDFFSFPRTRGDLDAIMDRLDEAGIEAAVIASAKLGGLKLADDPDKGKNDRTAEQQMFDEAKK